MASTIPCRAACVKSCQEISSVDVKSAQDAVTVLQQTMSWVKQMVRWLALGVPLQVTSSLDDAPLACAGAAVLAVTVLAVVATSRLYFKEVLDRCRVWQEQHPQVMLHPPFAQLRHMLLLHLGCAGAVLVTLVAVWCTLFQ